MMIRQSIIVPILLSLAVIASPALAQNDVITTLAGGGPKNLLATSSNIDQSTAVAVDSTGNLYIASPAQHRIFRVDSATKLLTVFAGNSAPGYSGDGGPAIKAALHSPESVALDALGNLFIADTQNNVIRKVDLTGKITTVVGTGASGYGGDHGPALDAFLARPFGLAFDLAGSLYFADIDNNRVRRVDAGGTITTEAGNGQADFGGDGGPAVVASLNQPMSVAVDTLGNLYISDGGNHRVRKVNAQGVITTKAGNGGISSPCTNLGAAISGPATSLSLSDRTGLGVDSSGNLFIADTDASCVRKVNLAGTMTTVAGDGNFSFAGDGASALAASLNSPLGVAVDATGTLFIADTGNLRIRRVVGAGTPGSIITSVAGNGLTYSGDSFAAVDASLDSVQGVAIDGSGNIYIADSNDNLVRKVDVNGIITTAAGNGCFGYSVGDPPQCDKPGDPTAGDGVQAIKASLAGPAAVAVDNLGNIFIADASNHRIRKVDTSGKITTEAGNGTPGFAGEGLLATNAELNFPSGVAVDASANLFIADTDNHRIRKVDAGNIITTFAGTGTAGFGGDTGPATSALLNFPTGVAFDRLGQNLYVADLSNNRVRRVNLLAQTITTLAGTGVSGFSGDSGPALSAQFNFPAAVTLDSSGNLFVADFSNQRIRRVDAASQIIITVAGDGNIGFSGDGGPANLASLANPSGLAVDALGNLLIADTFNNRIRKVSAPIVPFISFSASSVAFPDQVVGTSSAAQPVTVTNAGNAPLIISQISILSSSGAASADFSETDTCSSPVEPGANCTVILVFKPSVAGPKAGSLVFTDNAAGGVQIVTLTGTGVLPYSLIADRTSATVEKGTDSTTFNFSAQSQSNFAANINLSCTGNAPAVCSFNPASISLGQNSVLTISNLSAVTGNMLSFTVTGTSGSQTSSLAMTVNVADFSISASPTTASVSAGQVAAYTLTIQPSGGFNQLISLNCSGAPLAASCSVSPNSVALDGTHPVTGTLNVNTTAITTASALPQFTAPGASGLGTLIFFFYLAISSGVVVYSLYRRRVRLLFAGLLAFILSWAACGASGQLPILRGTPAGSYTISVTATSGSLSHNTNLSLTVK